MQNPTRCCDTRKAQCSRPTKSTYTLPLINPVLILDSTEKFPRMFSTLVISLPSSHTGGDVKIRHAGTELMLLRTSTEMQSFLWWYALLCAW
ncbi:hypothetical protein BCR34DRAFT_488253 [Clohesyomyces aquaticus]|uniref:Uncharacterized protein n=1 Tax=Clohesyomyces aquaticus TaxID=1231657 RepID=A0A1Y1ZEU1_9PLEO|nr:hypothetical protein BCR34DRAFT_488253 [Clohesyomyces aquaticus]